MKHKIFIFLTILLTLSYCKQTHLRVEDLSPSHEATYRSNSLVGSIAGFIIGPILFIYSFILIWNNERKAAVDHRRMALAKKIVKEVDPMNPQQIMAANGELVHVSGDSQCY